MWAVATDSRRWCGSGARLRSWLAVAGLAVAGGAAHAQQATVATEAWTPGTLTERAIAYEHGEGVPKDQAKAIELYCEAARAGDPEAMFNLGWMYANGRGVARDDAVAATLFAQAAALGHAYAGTMLKFVEPDGGVVFACMLPPEPEQAAVSDDEALGPFALLPPEKKKIADVVIQTAPAYAIDPRLALAIVAVESDFHPRARSPKDARGVMQLIGDTAARFDVKNRMDVADNVRGGLAYLRWLLAYFKGEVKLVVAAYNAGEAAVDKYRGIPPYPETREYVRRVLRLFPSETHPYDPAIVEPSPAVFRSASTAR
jgi:TPR repeat protein